MRTHPERSRETYNVRKDLGLSPRARFCTVIRQDNLVIEMYPDDVQLDALTARATSIMLQTDKVVSYGKLRIHEEYSAIRTAGGKVETKFHGVNDGIICKAQRTP